MISFIITIILIYVALFGLLMCFGKFRDLILNKKLDKLEYIIIFGCLLFYDLFVTCLVKLFLNFIY